MAPIYPTYVTYSVPAVHKQKSIKVLGLQLYSVDVASGADWLFKPALAK